VHGRDEKFIQNLRKPKRKRPMSDLGLVGRVILKGIIK
jgi:hypothetical protein